MVYRFGRTELNGARYELLRDGRPVPVEPRVLELLVYLVAHRDRVVTKEELLDALWKEAEVTEWALTRTIHKARAVLDDPEWIAAVYGRGYKFEAPVTEVEAAAPLPSPQAPAKSEPAPAPPEVTKRRAVVLVATAVALIIAAAVWFAFRQGPSAPEVPGVRSLAVLPLRDLSGAAGEEYFADGLTEALIARLANLGGLRVISRTSAMRYRDTARALPEIARELGVEAALAGTVLRAGERVRINVRLVRAATGENLWAAEFERELGDLLDVQGEIARAVAAAVEHELTADEATRLARAGPINAEAYRRYLLARFHAGHRTIEGLETSLGHLEAAIRLAPRFAPAHAAHAEALILFSSYYGMRPEEAFPRARAAAEAALALDPLLSEAHAALGMAAFAIDWDLAAAERSYRRALELAPGNAAAHQGHGEILSLLGRHDEAVAAGRRAVELDPLSAVMHASLGQRLNGAGRPREALVELASTLDLEPRFAWLHRERAYAFEQLGDPRSALAERVLEMELRNVDEERLAALRGLAAAGGLPEFWRWEAGRLEALASERYVPALLLAEAAEGSGDRRRALSGLARAIEERGIHLLQVTTSPELGRLAGDPAGRALLAGAGIEVRAP